MLGTGGMGRVYLAEHVAIQKRVALKVLHPQYSQKRDIVERFQQEAISASRIKHPGVLEVFDFGELPDGSAYIAMELLEGRDLGETLEKFGPLRPELALEVLLQVCRALDAAHAAGVVHRDLKPDNVFLHGGDNGHPIVKIVDFGIARLRENDEGAPESEGTQRRRLTKTGMIFGTPEYMAPEQAQGKEADARSDIYATGVILFELLTGAVPFTGKSFLEVLNRHVLFAVPRLAEVSPELVVSPDLEDVMRRALAKNPAERFASMRELAEALLQVPEAMSLRAERASQSAWRVRGAAPATASSPSSVSSPAVTQVAGTPLTASEDMLPKRGTRGFVLGGSAALVVAAAAAYFLTRSPDAPATTAAHGSPAQAHDGAQPAQDEKTAASRVSEPGAKSAAPSANPAAHIALHVVTNPSGAVVQKDGFQVCDAAPCDVLAAPNETLVLTAELGERRGEVKVLAQREQNVTITLRAAPVRPKATSRAPSSRPSPAAKEAPALCEVVVDGLKILRPCQ